MVASRRFLRAIATVTVAVGVLVGALTSISLPSSAATASVTLVGGPTSATVAANGVVTVAALITNQGSAALAAGTLEIASSEEPLLNEGDLNSWLAGKGNDGQTLATVNVSAVPAKGSVAVNISIPASALPDPAVWGVRGLLVSYNEGAAAATTLRTTVVLLAPRSPAVVSVATVLPIVGPASSLGLITQAELAKATGVGGYLNVLLNYSTTAPVSYAVDPRITTSILTLGASAPTSATTWLKTLNSTAKSGFWLTYGDSDISGQIQAGAKSPVQPRINDLPNIPEPVTGTTWDGLNWPGWAPTLSNVAWPLANSVSPAVLNATASNGYTRVVLSAGNLTGQAPVRSAGVVGKTPAAIVNDTASACAQQLTRADTGPSRNYASACLTAHVAVAASSNPGGASVVLALGRTDSTLNSGSFANALSTIAGIPFATPTTLNTVYAQANGAVTLAPKSESAPRLTTLKTPLANQNAIVAFSPVAATPDLVINPGARRLAAITSSAWLAHTDWQDGLTANSALTNEVLNAVSIVTSSTINMVSGQARIPVIIRNDLPSAVSVTVRAIPSNARIVVDTTIPLTVEANSQGRAYIPVSARVGSGSVDLKVSLTDRTGNPVGVEAILPVNVRADWETFGLVGLAVVFFGLITAGIIRTIRRRPRKTGSNE